LEFDKLTKDCVFRYRFFNDNTLTEIRDGSIWHASLDSLNDPYELPLIFDWSCFKGNDLPRKLTLINKQLMLFDPMDKLTSYLVNNKVQEAANYMTQTIRIALHKLEAEYRSSLVTCFSKEPLDALMWSHYANGMRGICIAYDVEILQESDEFSLLYEVDYNDKVFPFTYSDFELKKQDQYMNSFVYNYADKQEESLAKKQLVIRNITHIFQKHTRWEYEKEVRNVLLAPNKKNSGKAVFIKKDAIKAIMYGSKIHPPNLHVLKRISEERGIPLYKASPKIDNFTVKVEPT